MKTRRLGNTGLEVSEIGFGAWAIGGNRFGNSYGETQDEVSLAALNTAYELGCTFFDTADVYGHGHSETLLGQALKGWDRDRVVIATKVGGDFYANPPRLNFSEKHIRFALEQSLRRLGTDRIDLYQLHNPSLPLIQHGAVFQVMQALQAEGKIRFYGISIFDPQEGIQALQKGQVNAVQAVYNLFDRRPEKGLLDACHQAGAAVIAREPLANGFLTGKFRELAHARPFVPGDIRYNWPEPLLVARAKAAEDYEALLPPGYAGLPNLALKFVLSDPRVSVVIPGCKTPEQVRENMAASDLPDLSAEDLQRLSDQNKIFA